MLRRLVQRLWALAFGNRTLTFDDLLAPVAGEIYFEDVLEAWSWLIPRDVTPLVVTAFGDMFLVAPDGSVRFLDSAAGTCAEVAASVDEWKEKIREPGLQDEWFMPGLLKQLRKSGQRLARGECYSTVQSICLGGSFTPENWRPTPWRVHIVYAGSLHEALKDVPPGTKITDIRFPRL